MPVWAVKGRTCMLSVQARPYTELGKTAGMTVYGHFSILQHIFNFLCQLYHKLMTDIRKTKLLGFELGIFLMFIKQIHQVMFQLKVFFCKQWHRYSSNLPAKKNTSFSNAISKGTRMFWTYVHISRQICVPSKNFLTNMILYQTKTTLSKT